VEISRRLVHTGGVWLYPGTNFGDAGNGFFRMNLACPRSQLQLGLERIRSSIIGD
jgi:cystathionine beta-lyase